jgi:hypothetical protein
LEHVCFKLRRERVDRRRGILSVLLPAYPRYIFVSPRYGEVLLPDYSVIQGRVHMGDEVAWVSPTDIERMKAECEQIPVLGRDGVEYVLKIEEFESVRFKCGDRVRVNQGTAQGYYGIFQRLHAPDRAIILVEWMGRLAPTEVLEADLEIPTPRKKRKRRNGRRRWIT